MTLLDSFFRHLDTPGTFVRVLIMEFSSAFNTLQPHLLIKRLLDLDVSPGLVLWVRAFLRDRPQRVSINGTLSDEIVINTGAPQGCVLSPILFSLYTNELTCDNNYLTLIKFADDMALISRLKNEHSLLQYFEFTHRLVNWFNESFLKLNVTKTMEICFEEHRARDPALLRPLKISSVNVEQVDSFKYLGTVLDKHLKFSDHVDFICKKANQRMYLVRKLNSFGVDKYILEMVYRSLVESILSFNIVTWFGNLGVRDRNRINRIVKGASKVIGKLQKPISEIYKDSVFNKAKKIIADDSHPMNSSFNLLPSGRRFRAPSWKRNLYGHSYVPNAIRILNSSKL